MRTIAWVTDSTAMLDADFAREHDVYVVPLCLIAGDEVYRENVDITSEQFYEKMREHEKVSSSQPPIGEFIRLYESLKGHYDDIIVIHCSSELSGTYHSSLQAAEIAETPIIGIDSKIGAFPLREMILQGILYYREGMSALEIRDRIQGMINDMSFYMIPASLSQLHRSGRVSGTQLVISNLLSIHLLLRFQEGKVIVEDKIRTMKKARLKLLDVLKKDMEHVRDVCIMHANNMEGAFKLKEEILHMAPLLRIEIASFIPVAGIHAGEGTLALAWIKNHYSALGRLGAPASVPTMA
ncbi:DegV family protein [Paenibacillus hunanensis]|uniref:DegV family protein with EDD domain n=1 Tax=Paenibacillus hunanensis TaxID=539262 RepID=A0ABU1IVD3_9BACL|nr:DegV family protein [Paenibacillus hunanensis]MDR6242975.1 DegV family protein with EDD domain [Paenibacillus hunanensis]GGJ12944.1 alanine aminotransferase [Paenibacillus hunanensis]